MKNKCGVKLSSRKLTMVYSYHREICSLFGTDPILKIMQNIVINREGLLYSHICTVVPMESDMIKKAL